MDTVRLREAVKDYSPLSIHFWHTSGSKTGFDVAHPKAGSKRHRDILVKGIADTIQTKPDEQWLLVIHKKDRKVGDIERDIRRQLPNCVQDKIKVISWGNHMATNLYAEVQNVILAGTLFMPASFNTALTHLAQDRDVALGLASAEEIRNTIRGEHRNLVFQAICRGRVRKSEGDRCLQMNAYVIAAKKHGIAEDLISVFPNCLVSAWRPASAKLTKHTKAALAVLDSALTSDRQWISYNEVAVAVGIDPRDLRRSVLQRPEWADLIQDRGLIESVGPRRAKGLQTMS